MNKATSRRALLHVGALSGIAAASGLALPALARDTKKTGAEEAISPPEDLMREHAILDRILLVYEAGMRRAGQGVLPQGLRFQVSIPMVNSVAEAEQAAAGQVTGIVEHKDASPEQREIRDRRHRRMPGTFPSTYSGD